MDYINNLANSLSAQFGNLLPGVLGALIVLIIGFLLAKILKSVSKKILKKTNIDEKIGQKLNTSFRIDNFVAKLVYYIVVIYTLLIVLNLLGVNSVLEPLQDMMKNFLSYLPNIIGAGVIGFAGYMIATIASEATGFLAARVETFSQSKGIDTSKISIAKIIRQIVFIFVFVPILIIALDTLKMDAISGPATAMLNSFMMAIPKIVAAVVLITVFYIVGKYLINIAIDLLQNLGIDNIAQDLGISKVLGQRSLAATVGNIGFFFIMFTGIIAAVDKLELTEISNILSSIFEIAGRVFFGLIVLFGGITISNIATKAIAASGNNKWLASVVRFAILGIFLAFALHTMGIAPNIVELAFGLTLGAVAVAFALAFGLGAREAAGKQAEEFFNNLKK